MIAEILLFYYEKVLKNIIFVCIKKRYYWIKIEEMTI